MWDMPTAISAVVGAAIVGVVLTPDLTRYARNTWDCVVASFLGQGGGMTIAYVFGMIPVLVWNELEPMTYMFLVGFGGLALAVLTHDAMTYANLRLNVFGRITHSATQALPAPGTHRAILVTSSA